MIREAVRSDRDALLAAALRLNATGTVADPRYRLRPDATKVLRERLGEVWCLVDERDGVVAGFVAGEPRRDHPILDQPHTCTISDLWVEEPFRRQGIGRALVAAFRVLAERRGFPRIEVTTLARDARALAFWRSVGFDNLRVTLVG